MSQYGRASLKELPLRRRVIIMAIRTRSVTLGLTAAALIGLAVGYHPTI